MLMAELDGAQNKIHPGDPMDKTNWVTATGEGLLDLTSLNLLSSTGIASAVILPAGAVVITGPPGQNSVNIFSGPITGPTSFGSGTAEAIPDSGTGSIVGIDYGHSQGGSNMFLLVVPAGPPFSGQVDFTNASRFDTLGTFSSLGVTPGTYQNCDQSSSSGWTRRKSA
jgi:hypothetical protein